MAGSLVEIKSVSVQILNITEEFQYCMHYIRKENLGRILKQIQAVKGAKTVKNGVLG